MGLPSYRIIVTPDRFEASTQKMEKYENLRNFVVATFKVLEHTPVTAIGVNILFSLKFRTSVRDLMFNYFSSNKEKMCEIFGDKSHIESKVIYYFNKIRVQAIMELDEENNKIKFNFNYNKDFSDQNDTKAMGDYLLKNFDSFLLNAKSVIKQLFDEPIERKVGNNA